MNLGFIAIGGFIGALSRFLISTILQRSTDRFPMGTYIINLSGSFLLGWLFGSQIGQIGILFLGTGFCGAFTTFSTLQWELIQLKQNKQPRNMILYISLTYSFGIIMASLGYLIGKMYLL
jgi:fluoride exporter